ncbi:MAG: hypothetical protein JWQ35_2107 [Bacteriovoracaceae bacterium]|nr:hypothetical protein [Bacteriovoracaceae bacterium]
MRLRNFTCSILFVSLAFVPGALHAGCREFISDLFHGRIRFVLSSNHRDHSNEPSSPQVFHIDQSRYWNANGISESAYEILHRVRSNSPSIVSFLAIRENRTDRKSFFFWDPFSKTREENVKVSHKFVTELIQRSFPDAEILFGGSFQAREISVNSNTIFVNNLGLLPATNVKPMFLPAIYDIQWFEKVITQSGIALSGTFEFENFLKFYKIRAASR